MSDLAEPIKDLKLQIDKKPINFNELLPTDIHSDWYDLSKTKNFSELEQQFAKKISDEKHILGVASKIAQELSNNRNLNRLNCSKAIDIIKGANDKNSENHTSDICAIVASCAIIANALSEKEEEPPKTESYQLPKVSSDMLINEIYNYIMSKE